MGGLPDTHYRKPTSTDRYITSDFNYFGAQKQAAFRSMSHRHFQIPMEKREFEAERKKIHEAAFLNGYNEGFMNNILRKHERKKHRLNATTLHPQKGDIQRISFPFYPKVTNAIQGVLKQHGFQTAYKSAHTLKDLLCSLKDKIPPDEKSGIYEIPCKSCPAVYIGQTRRKLKVRLREHRNAVENKRLNESSVAAHSTGLNHEIYWDNARLKKCVRKASHLKAWEPMYFHTAEPSLTNEFEAPITSNLFNLAKQNIQ
ncbi:uncharacterized protein LOC129774296 [Toxorhynchites rutilus septentrionalis]|uniref:uncharacterized protein LOC129774296 n=1 Tax=Toxorhynchites rutilus septentrionalis TaxID=329112 RepID=UPI00247A03A0|nr:uncharacterized protein LOC129774296 [Toxorhynchites rutilus septentrionalis]